MPRIIITLRKSGNPFHTDQKADEIFLIFIRKFRWNQLQLAKSKIRKGFLIYEEMRKYLIIYEKVVSHAVQYMTCNRSFLNFLIYEENLSFFLSVHSIVDLSFLRNIKMRFLVIKKKYSVVSIACTVYTVRVL